MSNPVNYGVCGLGRIGVKHCHHFSAFNDRFKPVAFCDTDSARAEEAANHYGGSAYTDYSTFLSNAEMELVIIATRSLDHARHARQALLAGKKVLLEKPIGVTAEDYQLLMCLAQEYPDRLYCGHNHRFEPAFANARAIVADGLLGNIQVVKLSKHHAFMRRNDWQMRLDCGGGQLSVWAPHLLDQSLQMIGAPVQEVTSCLRNILQAGDADDHVRINLSGSNGIVAEIEISNAVAIHGHYCTIIGDRGTLVYGQRQKEITLRYLDPEFCWPKGSASSNTPELGAGSYGNQDLPWIEETRPVEPAVNMWEYVEDELARHLYNAIRNSIPFPVTNQDALEVVRITEIVKKQNPQFQWIG